MGATLAIALIALAEMTAPDAILIPIATTTAGAVAVVVEEITITGGEMESMDELGKIVKLQKWLSNNPVRNKRTATMAKLCLHKYTYKHNHFVMFLSLFFFNNIFVVSYKMRNNSINQFL